MTELHDFRRRLVYQRPTLYPKQRKAMFDERRISLIEASTKSGKTASGIIWLYEQAMQGDPGQNFWWVAPVFSQSRIAFNRMRRHFLDERGQSLFATNLTHHTLETEVGTVISFRSGDHPDTLYGEDVYACVIDEASRFKEDAWYAIRSTLTKTRGRIRIIGNVKGRKNWFYLLARQAEAKTSPELGYHKLTAHDAVEAGVLNAQEIEEARRTLPDSVFRELYLAEPAEDEGNPFGSEHIKACIVERQSKLPPAAWGWDLARKQDWTVGIALDREGVVCKFLRFRRPWNDTTLWAKREIGRTPAVVDETGVGDAIVEQLRRTIPGEGVLGCRNVEGYLFTQPKKQMLIEGLALAIHRGDVKFPEGPIARELRNFEYEFTRTGIKYSAPPGHFDDCVCALAMAVWCKTNRKYKYDTSGAWIE
jgi:hypothetical protein